MKEFDPSYGPLSNTVEPADPLPGTLLVGWVLLLVVLFVLGKLLYVAASFWRVHAWKPTGVALTPSTALEEAPCTHPN